MIKAQMDSLKIRCLHFDILMEETALRKALTYKVPNYWFVKAYRQGAWDGTMTFYNSYGSTFPTGLLSILPQELQETILITDVRKKPVVEKRELQVHGVELRDYQIEIIEEAVREGRAIISAPTNAGKTEVGAGIMSLLPVRTLWLTHRGNLLYQTKERLEERLGEKVGVIGGTEETFARITVAMVQAVHSRLKSDNPNVKAQYLKWLSNMQMLIVDECHHQSASTWFNIANKCHAYYRFGMSATPLLQSEIGNVKLIAVTGKEIQRMTNLQMIQKGYSAVPMIYRIQNEVLRYLKAPDYRTAYALGIEQNKERNRVIAHLMCNHAASGQPVLVLVNTLLHGNTIIKEYRLLSAYKSAIFVDGSTDYEERNRLLRKLEKGSIGTIVATQIFDEGADVPNIRVLILAAAGRSHIQLLQRVGRGMRKKSEGENKVIIYDFVDKGDRYLAKHSLHRLKLFHDEGFDVIPLQMSTEGDFALISEEKEEKND